jgi:glycerate kinase
LAVIISGILQGKKTDKVASEAKAAAVGVAVEAREVAAGVDSIASSKLDVIHSLVNQRLASETRMKEAALARVKELEEKIGGTK